VGINNNLILLKLRENFLSYLMRWLRRCRIRLLCV